MANVNKVIIIGYLGKDPQITTTQQGIKVARLSVGTTERGYTSKSGQQIPDKTEWHDVVIWRQGAEFAERFCRKGSQVYVQGKLRHRSYVDNNNQTRYITEIEAEEIQSLDRAAQNNANEQQHVQSANVASVAQETAQGANNGGNDDLPF
jgi:single-strand DNA-binding protein